MQDKIPEEIRLNRNKDVLILVYADKICEIEFSDGHDTGLYDWDYLYQLSIQQQQNWAEYMQQLQLAGASREPC